MQIHLQKRVSSEVMVGNVAVGGSNPVRVQSMTSTPTLDTPATVEQIIRIAEAGAEIVRMTVQSMREAENLANIKKQLFKRECFIPLVADVHFNPAIAETAAAIVDKVRINPGNYGIKSRGPGLPSSQTSSELSDEAYANEMSDARTAFTRLLDICLRNGTALRIGVNHGSLSPRIINRYGNTPEGMVISAMEFLRFCREEDFHNVVVSLKSSNIRVMVMSNRMMADRMAGEGMSYPLHLGVTEAGEGEDGRIRSAAGIGTLLWQGIGDTIRVSLTEDPEREVPVARSLLEHIEKSRTKAPEQGSEIRPLLYSLPAELQEKGCQFGWASTSVQNIGGVQVPVVISSSATGGPDYIFDHVKSTAGGFPVIDAGTFISGKYASAELNFLQVSSDDITGPLLSVLAGEKHIAIIAVSRSANTPSEMQHFIKKLRESGCNNPVIFKKEYPATDIEYFQVAAAADFGPLFLDGLGDGLWLVGSKPGDSDNSDGSAGKHETDISVSTSFSVLQSARARTTKTEFISCPSCGRTMFDIQKAVFSVKESTSHLKGLKIAVMGCIVNGPGEMADADYGYVGSGKGRVTLYKKQSAVKRNIPESAAIGELIDLIKESGDWVEP